jgi:hypothetical protein
MYKRALRRFVALVFLAVTAVAGAAQSPPLEIDAKLQKHFRFVAYGDTRFTDPSNTKDANPEVRQQLVRALPQLILTSSPLVAISLLMATT